MISPKTRGFLLPLLLLAACGEPAALVTAPTPANGEPVVVYLAPGEYMLGRRSTAADLVGAVSLIEIRRRPDDTLRVAARTSTSTTTTSGMGPGRARSNSLSASGSTTFGGFWHFPTETGTWEPTIGDSAYYRDLSIAVLEIIRNPNDGDTWTEQATLPDGSVFDFQGVTFHSSWNGASDCFVVSGTGQTACGVQGVDLYTTRQIQCGQTGTWTYRLSLNGVQYDERQVKVVAKVNENYVPLMSQGNAAWGPNHYAHACPKVVDGVVVKGESRICPDTASDHYTIHGKGCAMTSAAMVMGYHGAVTDPGTLNTWLRDNEGYDRALTIFQRTADFASVNGAPGYTFFGGSEYRNSTTVEVLKGLICKYGPQEISVKGNSHFVVAFGYDEERQAFVIHDPAGGRSTTLLDYGNIFNGIRPFMGKERTDTLFAGMTLTFHSPVQAVLTDPSGRRTGLDPRAGTVYAEIPNSYADSSFTDNDDDPSEPRSDAIRELHVEAPMAGTYVVTVVGTGVGTYTSMFRTTGAQRGQNASQTLIDVPTSPGEVHTYEFSYDPASVTPTLAIRGAFQGGGQRDEVDDFLTYVAPTERQTTLPAGTMATRVTVIYGRGIDATTFRASLEGADVTGIFHPVPGSRETVTIPLLAGRNVLKLGVTSKVGSRTATDQDQLVFIVK